VACRYSLNDDGGKAVGQSSTGTNATSDGTPPRRGGRRTARTDEKRALKKKTQRAPRENVGR